MPSSRELQFIMEIHTKVCILYVYKDLFLYIRESAYIYLYAMGARPAKTISQHVGVSACLLVYPLSRTQYVVAFELRQLAVTYTYTWLKFGIS